MTPLGATPLGRKNSTGLPFQTQALSFAGSMEKAAQAQELVGKTSNSRNSRGQWAANRPPAIDGFPKDGPIPGPTRAHVTKGSPGSFGSSRNCNPGT
jgi:hypothetical protein